MKFSIKLKRLADKNDVVFSQFTEYHIQLKALHTVNVYESKSTFYINGMVSKEVFDPSDLMFLINLAKGAKNFSYTKEKAVRKSFKKGRRRAIWQRNPVCYYCHDLIENYNDATIEHRIPISRGGSNRPDNLALSHNKCNQERGNNIGIKK